MQFHFKNLLLFSSLLFAFLFLLLSSSLVHAQSNTGSTDVTQAQYTLLAPLPELGGNCPSSNSTCTNSTITSISLSDFISYAYKFMIALAVVLAVFMITVGGFEYMLSGAADTKSDALKKIQNAVWGLLLALVTYLLLYTIDPNLVSTSNLSIPPISYPTTVAPVTAQSITNTSNANLNQSYSQTYYPANTVNQASSPFPVSTPAPATTPANTTNAQSPSNQSNTPFGNLTPLQNPPQ
jgi:hypothetical protein